MLTELDENATVVSVEGIGALNDERGPRHMVDGEKILPFVRAFYGKPSWWEDDVGDIHAILFCLGQHAA